MQIQYPSFAAPKCSNCALTLLCPHCSAPSRKEEEAYWSQYDDVVTLNEFRKMLGGLGEVQARRLLQNKIVKSFKIRGEYHIPKQCVIDYVLSTHYAKYRQILKAQIP